ncbi:NlpC/P60 family protein [Enterocloster clostridioformis]|uniref:C40 family peptidase n=1 Tax=Enterocloster clostridioformis TaxID=1531 RepID=UPI00232D7D7F|nr:NlpC/P60 family protein [Enterocloster clostridioformis]MDB2134755.1 NlpC/P60 family protein [Enterocloster clostridioformis]
MHLKIKKVDDKPMVIHTKQKAKIHTHEPKQASIKGSNIYTVDRDPTKKKTTEGTYRKSTVHQVSKEGRFAKLRKNVKESNQSIKVNNHSLRNAGMVGGKAATDQIEGGEELQQSAMIMYEASRPVTGTASRGAELFKRQAINKQKLKIKKVDAGKKLARKGVKDTAKKAAKETGKKVAKDTAKTVAKETSKAVAKTATTAATTAAGTSVSPGLGTVIGFAAGEVVGETVAYKMDEADMKNNVRSRKIKFFLDKMKAQDEQTDSFAKLVKDVFVQKGMFVAKYVAKLVLPLLLGLVLLVSVVAIPVVAVVGTIYNSPFAIFLPPLEDGDTVTSVASSYVAEFNREVNELASNHTGYDAGKIVYVGYEGEGSPSNYYDILAVYMVKHGVGDTATIMNDTSKGWLQTIVDDMCTYTTSSGTETETTENEDGSTTTTTTSYLYVNVTLKSCYTMASEYGFTQEQMDLLVDFMSPENLALLGYSPGGGSSDPGVSSLSETEIQAALADIPEGTAKKACEFALRRVGYPYSQALRHSGTHFDCSSLVYYAWLDAGVDISYGGASTAGYEAQGLAEAGKTVVYEEMQPGDLIFFSYEQTDGYLDISHVGMYVGNGKMVDARGTAYGVVYRDVPNNGAIVMIGRPD